MWSRPATSGGVFKLPRMVPGSSKETPPALEAERMRKLSRSWLVGVRTLDRSSVCCHHSKERLLGHLTPAGAAATLHSALPLDRRHDRDVGQPLHAAPRTERLRRRAAGPTGDCDGRRSTTGRTAPSVGAIRVEDSDVLARHRNAPAAERPANRTDLKPAERPLALG